MKKQALLIGINEYFVLSGLKYARQDAESFAEAIKACWGFSDSEITLMTCSSPGATRATSRFIEQAISDMADCRNLDLFVVGFWGHGFAPVPGRRYLCGIDTIEDDLERTAVSLDVIRAKLAQIGAMNTLMLLDCCQNCPAGRSAGAAVLEKGAEQQFTSIARDIQAAHRNDEVIDRIPTVAIMNACREGQKAYEWDDRRHGVFTAHLLEGIETGHNSVAQLASWVCDKTPLTVRKLHRQKQVPWFTIEGRGDIQFALSESYQNVPPVPMCPPRRTIPRWWAVIDGQEQGPLDEQTVLKWIESGKITRTTEIWKEGTESWVFAGQIELFKSRFPCKPKITSSVIENIAEPIESAKQEQTESRLDKTMSNPFFTRDKQILESNGYNMDPVIGAKPIYIVTGCCAMTELMDRPIAELLRDKIDELSGKTTDCRAIIIGDIWWHKDTSLHGYPVISIGGPTVNSLTQTIKEKGHLFTYDHNVFGAYWEDSGVPRAALWGQTVSDTLKAVEHYLAAQDGISRFISACKEKQFPIKVRPVMPEEMDIDCGEGVTMKLKLIPAGKFMMGSPNGQGEKDEHPQHEVKITKPFYMGIHPVTQIQYYNVMKENPSKFKSSLFLPVETVCWNEAVEFCKRLSEKTDKTFRLPTEAQWEYACRAGTNTKYCFGDNEKQLAEYAWCNQNSDSKTHPVGQKKPNAWGLYDMHGNVWEWCSDFYDEGYYGVSACEDPAGPKTGGLRVVRGGSWDDDPENCRSASRRWSSPGFTYANCGFRVVCLPVGLDL